MLVRALRDASPLSSSVPPRSVAQLLRMFPRSEIPSLPPTGISRSLDKKFLEERQQQLEGFLQQLMSLPEVGGKGRLVASPERQMVAVCALAAVVL